MGRDHGAQLSAIALAAEQDTGRSTLSHSPPPAKPLEPAIVRELRRLPRRQREVVVLRFLCDFSTEEPASVLGIAPGTVTAHVHRSVATLRAALADLEREVHRG
jgi:DNA-directed RNA polymerase specialized sigma24 family protein